MEHDERQPEPSAVEPPSPSPVQPTDVNDESEDEFETPPQGSTPDAEPRAEPAWPAEPGIGEMAPPVSQAPSSAPVPEPPPPEAEAYVAPPAEDHAEGTPAHSVPATAIGASTQCPRCGTENRPGVAFCRQCGQRLIAPGTAATVERPGAPDGTQQCPRCGTHNRAGVAFCQNCGANLRATATPAPGYLPPGAPSVPAPAAASPVVGTASRGGAALGPIVLLVGAIGIATGWLLPFLYGTGSLWERSFGGPGGYGIAFWNGYPSVSGGLADQAYFGFAAPGPILVAVLVLMALGGFLRASPGGVQRIGLLIALIWSLGLVALFATVEVAGGWSGDLVQLIKGLTPGGIIFALASLIVLIGTLTRFARS